MIKFIGRWFYRKVDIPKSIKCGKKELFYSGIMLFF